MGQPKHIQDKFFDDKRRRGIYTFNTRLMGTGNAPTMRERTPKEDDQLRYCAECLGFYSNRYFSKHTCNTSNPVPLKPDMLKETNTKKIKEDKEFQNILNRFREGEVGTLCRENEMVQMIGYRHFNLRRYEEGKQDEVRKVIMAEMRELSRLYIKFQSLAGDDKSIEDMFSRLHLAQLEEAITLLATDEKSKTEKHGQKLFVDAVILRSLKTLMGYYSETMQDEKRKELKCFMTAYKHMSTQLYPAARQKCIQNSLEKARKPSSLPSQQSVKLVKNYIEGSINSILADYDIKKYATLRSLVVARLTLYNARRGEEAARMLLTEWDDAKKGVWLPDDVEQVDDPAEKYLVGKFKIAYLHGKGRKYVPVLVPTDLVEAIDILSRDRLAFGIQEDNLFLFATKSLTSHCSGWHAVSYACKMAGVSVSITATKMRHRVSCLFASLDMSTNEQQVFLDHMGHELAINRDNYQCPQALQAVRVMGKLLDNLDEGNYSDILTQFRLLCVEILI